MKTQEAIVLFQNYQRKRQSPESVVYDYSRSIEKILTQLQRRDSWQSISSSEIEDLVLSWTCKVSTKQKYLAQMRSFLNFCYHKGYHTLSWSAIFLPRVPKSEAHYLTEEQVHTLLEYDMDEGIRVSILLMLSTGMRISEALSLTKNQLKKAELVEGLYQVSVIGKCRKLRSVFIPQDIVAYSLQYACNHTKDQILDLPYWKIQQKLKKITKDLGFYFSAHTLRHTYLTFLVKNKWDLYKVQRLAGHSTVAITSRYLHATDYELAETAKLVNNLLQSSS